MSYEWYKVVEGEEPLEQGDIIPNCPILIPKADITNMEEIEVEVQYYNVIVLSQSCDLIYKKISMVLVAPIYGLEELVLMNPGYGSNEMKERLRRGYINGYHLLNKCDGCEVEGIPADFLVVDFKNVFAVEIDFLSNFVNSLGRRLKLLPPYREHLSQTFARFLMRVGLPIDIPQFSKNI